MGWQTYLAGLPAWSVQALIGSAILLLIVCICLVWRHLRRPEAAEEGEKGPIAKAYDGYGGVADHPYGVPVVAILGTASADLAGIVENLEPAKFDGERHSDRKLESARACLTRDGVVHVVDQELWQAGDWGRRWKRLVQAFVNDRPQRPLDGIAIAISANELIEAQAGHSDLLTILGEKIAETVAMVERHGAMRVPLYLVLTGGEAVPGFAVWQQCLEKYGGDHTLGWSVKGERAVFGNRGRRHKPD